MQQSMLIQVRWKIFPLIEFEKFYQIGKFFGWSRKMNMNKIVGHKISFS